ncbi:MAG: hypothetical protein SPI15_08945 [Candidatus Faecousia sp.]|nr:hypothetical protein [Clostridiales bacterium]MDY6180966.1 hypothetical protein [Candidatus Faecousia sp.]
MGIISGIQAISGVQKIKNGGMAKLSISQVTSLIINLPDAQKNLSKEEYNRVYSLFSQMEKCTTKMLMNMDLYFDTVVKIIKKFDKIAPYEKYSGGNEIEFSFLMADIRGENYEEIRRLQNLISKMENAMREKDAADRDNEKILAEAWSDADLSRMVARGEFPANQVSAYKQQRATLEMLVQTAPEIHELSVKQIAELKKQLYELEHQ